MIEFDSCMISSDKGELMNVSITMYDRLKRTYLHTVDFVFDTKTEAWNRIKTYFSIPDKKVYINVAEQRFDIGCIHHELFTNRYEFQIMVTICDKPTHDGYEIMDGYRFHATDMEWNREFERIFLSEFGMYRQSP